MQNNQTKYTSKELDSSLFQLQDSTTQVKLGQQQQNEKPKPVFFKEGFEIKKPGQQGKVIFGQLEQEQKTLYEILQPYLNSLATTTGQTVSEGSTFVYKYLKVGLQWAYDKFSNNVVPFAKEQLPKLIFVVTGSQPPQDSGEFTLLQDESELLNSIQQKTTYRKSGSAGKKRIIVPLGTDNDQKFLKYLQNEKYEIKYSFPIDIEDEQVMSQESFMIPSEQFVLLSTQATAAAAQKQLENSQKQKQPKQQIVQSDKDLQQNSSQQSSIKKDNKNDENKQSQQQLDDTSKFQNIQDSQSQQIQQKKIVYHIGNCCMFQLQGKNSIEYDLLSNIEIDQKTKSGYFVIPEKIIESQQMKLSGIREKKSNNFDSQTNEQNCQNQEIIQQKQVANHNKQVDNTRNVRVQIIDSENKNVKKEQRKLQQQLI